MTRVRTFASQTGKVEAMRRVFELKDAAARALVDLGNALAVADLPDFGLADRGLILAPVSTELAVRIAAYINARRAYDDAFADLQGRPRRRT